MGVWSKVVTNPLGLAGFALFLVFSFMGRMKQDDRRRWISPVAFLLAAVTLLGGIGIAYRQAEQAAVKTSSDAAVPAGPCSQQSDQVKQSSTGQGSPNVNCVRGDVVITVDQSNGKTEAQKVAQDPAKK